MASMPMTIPYLTISLILSLTYTLIHTVHSQESDHSNLKDLNLKLSQLELTLEETQLQLYLKSVYIRKCEKKNEELSHTIHQLESTLLDIKGAPDHEKIIKAFEEQVRELEADVKINDRDLQLLKLRTEDAENLVNSKAAQVKVMANIVTELWFHVQKLEQAREVIERRTAELRRHTRNQKCLFYKVINNLCDQRCQGIVASYTSKALNQPTSLFSAVKMYHHELQDFIKHKMEKNELTAVLVDEEVVFFLASLILVAPFMLALVSLLSI